MNYRSSRNAKTEFLLCLFLGIFGAHKFYIKNYKMGFIYLITMGLLGLGWFYDVIVLGFRVLSGANDSSYYLMDLFENIQSGVEFEHFLKELFERLGYIAELTPSSGDQGADLIIYKNRVKTVVQAKFYSNAVGNSAIQEVTAAKGYYNASEGLVVTNSSFTSSAINLANANNIILIDGERLRFFIKSAQ